MFKTLIHVILGCQEVCFGLVVWEVLNFRGAKLFGGQSEHFSEFRLKMTIFVQSFFFAGAILEI